MPYIHVVFAVFLCGVLALPAQADEPATGSPPASTEEKKPPLVDRAAASLNKAIEGALGLIGIRYKRGGSKPETGFDCSGFVGHVFREGMGLILPRSAKELSKAGESIQKEELKPGDLVFFNTMRRAFSHVGIYLGGNLFVHAPRTGGKVRIEDMSERYWTKRYNGARRINVE